MVAFVDVSDTTQSASGSLVKATLTAWYAALPVPVNITSASAVSLAVGRLGSTTPAFTVDSSTASQVAGLKVTGAATGGTVAVVITDSGAAANLIVNAKGTGTIGIGSVSTGRVTITPVTTITGALTLSAALTYGGVTLSNAVTGTGNMVLSASPTFTGTIILASASASGGLVVGTSVSSATANATPSAYSATQLTAFASTVSGASLMGYGTTNDVTLMNRAGTPVLGVVANSTTVTAAGAAIITGVVTIGHTASIVRLTQKLNINASDDYGGASLSTWSTDATEASLLDLNRSKSATMGTYTTVTTNDVLGFLTFRGANGSAFADGAYLKGVCTAAVAASNVPAKIEVYTTTSAGATNLCATFGADQSVTFAGALSGVTTLAMSGDLTLSGAGSDVIVAATAKFRLDGSASGDTYIHESSADVLSFVAGGSVAMAFSATSVAFSTATDVNLNANAFLRLGAMVSTNATAPTICLSTTTAPSGNPVGGIFIWSDSGAGKARGTSGTVTTFAPAEPHCPVCGSDFGHEWQNEKYGGTLRFCVKCLADELGARPWIQRITP